MSPLLRVAALSAILTAASPSFAQFLANPPSPPPTSEEKELLAIKSVPALLSKAKEAEAAKDWNKYAQVMERIMQLRPMAGNMKLELAAAYSQLGNLQKCYDALVRLQDQGYGFDIESDPRFEKAKTTRLWNYLVEQFGKNRKPSGLGKVAFTLPKQDLLLESLAYDPVGKTLLTGSVRDGSIYRILPNGQLKKFINADAKNGLWSVFDLAVDAKRHVLWVASAAVPHGKHVKTADYGRAGLFKFDLKTGEMTGRYATQSGTKPRLLSHVAVAPNGDAYVTDSINSEILRAQGEQFGPLLRNPSLSGLRSLAVDDSGKTLYLADYEQGILGLDLASGKAFGLAPPKSATLFGIEGLYYHQGHLIAIQNAFPPARVIRFKLNDAGNAIVGTQALDSNREEFDMPTLGAIQGDKIYFIANSQKELYDRYGLLQNEAALRGTVVFESDLKFAMDATQGQMRIDPSKANAQ